MQISESPKQNAFQIPLPLRSALPLPECSTARQTGKEYGQCVVVGDWLCYWPTIYSLTSCFTLCLSPLSLDERFVCLSLRIVVYVNMSACPAVHLSLFHVTLWPLPLFPSSLLSFRLQLCISNLRFSAEAYSHTLHFPLSSVFHHSCQSYSVTQLLDSYSSRRKYKKLT